MKKIQTTTVFIFSIITTILVICLFVFSLKIIKNKNEHISAVVSTLEGKLKEKENMVALSEKVAEIKKTGEILNNYLVDSNKIDVFVSYLEDLGSSLGSKISVENIEISKDVKNKILIKLLITGNFQNVAKTIGFLENIPYEVDINQMYLNKDLTPPTDLADKKVKTVSSPTWQADVSFNILSLN